MNRKSISKNYIYNLFYQVLVIVLPLITTPYLSRTLGAEAIGIHSYTLSIASYFILFGAVGVTMYGQREIAYVQEDKHNRTIAFWEIFLMRLVTMSISLLVFGLTYCVNGEYVVYYRILIIEILSQIIDISWFFQGIEEFKKTVVRNSIVKFIFVICIFIFIKNPSDLFKYILIITLADLFGNFSLWIHLPKYLKKVKIKELKIFKHFKSTVGLFIPQIAIQIYTVLDRTMIGMFCENKSEVGFYEQAQKVIKLLLTVVTSLGTVMVPRMTHTLAKGDMKMFKEYIKKSYSFVSLLAFPIMVGITLISKEFVPIFFGEGYEKVILLIQAISPIILFIGVSNLFGYQYLIPSKKQKAYTISVTVGAVVNFIFNLIFIKYWGALGASIATVVAEFLVAGVQAYFSKEILNIKEMLKISKNNIVASIIMFVTLYGFEKILGITGILSIILQVALGVFIYVIVLFIFKDKFFYDVKEKFIIKIKSSLLQNNKKVEEKS
ncbi:MAG: flippase [Clostridia bacterium]|nr:flippase [Clostridia bacterium]